jgi:Lipase maturation factor
MRYTALAITIIIALLSIRPAINLLSPGQIMNTSFDPFDLVNTYGAFGTVGKERLNLVIEGTTDNDSTNKAHWKPYIYKGLPVLPNRRPPQIAPYQLRLDWQLWFAAMATPEDYPWTVHLVWKLLHNDNATLSLFAANPFPGKPPRYVRVILYRYRFVKSREQKNVYWNRERIKTWLPAMSVNNQQLIEVLQREEWIR